MTPALIVAAACLISEAFFAASEISVISCDRMALKSGAQAGSRAARLLEAFLMNKQRLLATTLVGTQLSVVVSTVVMTFAGSSLNQRMVGPNDTSLSRYSPSVDTPRLPAAIVPSASFTTG